MKTEYARALHLQSRLESHLQLHTRFASEARPGQGRGDFRHHGYCRPRGTRETVTNLQTGTNPASDFATDAADGLSRCVDKLFETGGSLERVRACEANGIFDCRLAARRRRVFQAQITCSCSSSAYDLRLHMVRALSQGSAKTESELSQNLVGAQSELSQRSITA